MSKSLGTSPLYRVKLIHYEGRGTLFVLSSHYRKPIDFSDNELNQSKAGLERIDNAVLRIKEKLSEKPAEMEIILKV